MKGRPSRWRTWRWPIGFGVLTAAGLASALLGDDGWDVASWFALGITMAVCAWLAFVEGHGPRRR